MTTYFNKVKMDTLEAIRQAASTVIISYSHDEDGRITSAVKEKEFLTKLRDALGPQFKFEINPPRAFWDFSVNGIRIDLKLTKMKTSDNSFNKKSFMFTWSGVEPPKKDGNMNDVLNFIKAQPRAEKRDPLTEYHYLVVDKETGGVLLKSLVDIHTYKINCAPGNIMQINWNNELNNKDYIAPDRGAKMLELMKLIQESCRKMCDNMNEFVNYDIDSFK